MWLQFIFSDLPVEHRVDIVFLVDSSVEVTPAEFREQLKAVSSIVENMLILLREVRVSLLCYGADAKVSVKLNQATTSNNFIEGLNNSQFIGGERRIDIALHSAHQQFQSVDKPASKRLLVVFAKGRQAAGALPLKQVVEPFKDQGVRFFMVVTSEQNELKNLVAKSGNVYFTSSFMALQNILRSLQPDIISEGKLVNARKKIVVT